MARLLCIIGGLGGMANATCALARRLEAAGHEVPIASPPELAALIARRGLTHVPLDPPRRPHRPRSPLTRVLRRRALRDAGVHALAVERLPALVDEIAPDATLIELEQHAAIMTLVPTGRPVGLLCPFVSIHQHPGVPPMHHRTVPRRDGTDIAAIDEAWRTYRRWKRRHLATLRRRQLGLDQVSVLRTLAAATGFDLDGDTDPDAWLIPFAYRALPMLHLVPAAFDFPHQPRPGVHHAGPMVDPDRVDPPLPTADRARLDAVLARRAAGGDRRLVAVSLSTFAGPQLDLARRIGEAVRDRPDRELVIGLGGRAAAGELDGLPPNVHAFDRIPQLEVLEASDAAMLNAGSNSIIECVLCRVPMLVHSLDRNDQNGSAARVAWHGIGTLGSPSDPPETIARDLDRVLADEPMRAAVEALRTRFVAEESDQRAARAVASMFDLPRPAAG
jgi:UDP:flavonoid glycosyltransferase YjiC (YdhE family)